MRSLAVTMLSPFSADTGTKRTFADPELTREFDIRIADLVEARFAVLDQIHLVDRDDHVLQPEQLDDRAVALRLRQQLRDAVVERDARGVDENDRGVRRRCARHHVARVLLVARRVGDDELALRGREIAVRDVDRDALLALGFEAVGQQRQIDFIADGALVLRARDRRQLVRQHSLAVVQQAADQRALAVVDTARRDEAQHAEVFSLINAHDLVVPCGVMLRNNLASCAVPSRLRTPGRPCAWRRAP